MSTPKETKFGRKATEDDESSRCSTEDKDIGTILIDTSLFL